MNKPSSSQEAQKEAVKIDFPPKTTAVNAVQRVILDSITRVEAHNPFRRTTEASLRGRQSLQGDSGTSASMLATGAASSRQAPMSARSMNSSRSAVPGQKGSVLDNESNNKGTSKERQNKSTSIRSRLRLPPKRAASAALLRTPAGLTPAERQHKYRDAEKKRMRAREEARMLREAAAADASASEALSAAANGASEDDSIAGGKSTGDANLLEEDKTLRPRFGGIYAHEVFCPPLLALGLVSIAMLTNGCRRACACRS